MNAIEIVKANESDLDSVKQLAEKHMQDKEKLFNFYPPSDSSEIRETEKQVVFVAKRSNQLIGYFKLHSRESFGIKSGEAEFEIVVDEKYRGEGIIGKALLEEAIEFVKQNTSLAFIIARIPSANNPSERFCEKHGFKRERKQKKGTDWVYKIDR